MADAIGTDVVRSSRRRIVGIARRPGRSSRGRLVGDRRPRIDRRCAGGCARDADRGARRRHGRRRSRSTTTSWSRPAPCWSRSIRATTRSRSTRPRRARRRRGQRRRGAEQRADPRVDDGRRQQRRTGGVEQARGGVDAAREEVEAARARLDAAQARMREAEANATKAARDVERLRGLLAKDEVSQQQFDATVGRRPKRSARPSTRRSRRSPKPRRGIRVAESKLAQARAGEQQAHAELQTAQTAPQQVAATRRAPPPPKRASSRRGGARAGGAEPAYTTVKAPAAASSSKKRSRPDRSCRPGSRCSRSCRSTTCG